MLKLLENDKHAVIIAVVVIVIALLITGCFNSNLNPNVFSIVKQSLTGLFALAAGIGYGQHIERKRQEEKANNEKQGERQQNS